MIISKEIIKEHKIKLLKIIERLLFIMQIAAYLHPPTENTKNILIKSTLGKRWFGDDKTTAGFFTIDELEQELNENGDKIEIKYMPDDEGGISNARTREDGTPKEKIEHGIEITTKFFDLEEKEQIRTLAHELSHILLDTQDIDKLDELPDSDGEEDNAETRYELAIGLAPAIDSTDSAYNIGGLVADLSDMIEPHTEDEEGLDFDTILERIPDEKLTAIYCSPLRQWHS